MLSDGKPGRLAFSSLPCNMKVDFVKESVAMNPPRMQPQQIFCVLGMHRSGTSVAARLLNLLGVYLGPEKRLMEAGLDNPTGFWEHRELTRLNEEILGCLGGCHLEPPELAPGWIKHPALETIRHRARQIIDDEFGKVALWGWKDPRNCLTLPFWQDLLPSMKYLICLRNPVDVARSIERRNGVRFENGIRLWCGHITHAIQATRGQNRLLLFYEDVLTAPQDEFSRLAQFVGRPELAKRESIRIEVESFVSKMLQHFHTPLKDCLKDPALEFPAKALFTALRLYVDLERKKSATELDADSGAVEAIDIFAAEIAAATKYSDEIVRLTNHDLRGG